MPRPASLVVLLLLALSFDRVRSDEVIVSLLDGRAVRGEVVEIGEREVTLRIEGRETVLAFDRIEPVHLYHLRRGRIDEAAPEAAGRHLDLAGLCRDAGLWHLAEREVQRAGALDPTLEGLVREGVAEAREGAAGALLAEARDRSAAGDAARARREMEDLAERYPATRAALLVRAELAALDEGRARAQERRERRDREKLERRQEARARRIERVEGAMSQVLERALADRDEATASSRYARGRRLLREAVGALESLGPTVEALARVDAERAARWRERLGAERVILYNILAVVDIESQNSRGANFWLSQALLLDPENERAHELRTLNATHGVDQDPFRIPLGELAGRVARGAVSGYELRVFLKRTGGAGLGFQSFGTEE